MPSRSLRSQDACPLTVSKCRAAFGSRAALRQPFLTLPMKASDSVTVSQRFVTFYKHVPSAMPSISAHASDSTQLLTLPAQLH